MISSGQSLGDEMILSDIDRDSIFSSRPVVFVRSEVCLEKFTHSLDSKILSLDRFVCEFFTLKYSEIFFYVVFFNILLFLGYLMSSAIVLFPSYNFFYLFTLLSFLDMLSDLSIAVFFREYIFIPLWVCN